MRLPERFLVLLLLAAGHAAHADPIDLKPFRATYIAEWKGMTAASSTVELEARRGGDTYTYSSVNTRARHVPHGVSRRAHRRSARSGSSTGASMPHDCSTARTRRSGPST